jgi:hypothetical protein
MREYSSFPNYHPYDFLVRDDEYFDTNTLTEELLDFMQHKLIIVRQKNSSGNDDYTFELSLFGIVLVISLVRYHNMSKLDLYLLNNKSISFQDCFERIILCYSSYKKVLPLIFGKWNLLKDVLREISAYNFDVILDKKARTTLMDSSVVMKGNKEFYNTIVEVALHNRKQLIEVFEAGLAVNSGSYHTPSSELDSNSSTNRTISDADNDGNDHKDIAVYQKLAELAVLLKYADPKSFYEDESGKHTKYLKSLSNLESSLYEIEVLEKAFADEISFVYYLNLNQDIYFPVLFPQDDYFAATHLPYDKGKSKEFLSREYDKYSLTPQKSRSLPMAPKERLLEIFRQDKEIREWFSSWIADSLEYQKQVTEAMFLFYDKIR